MKAILLLPLLLPFLAFAQLPLNWEQTYGGNSDETLHGLTEATNGWLLATGETASKTAGGKDGLLVIADFSTGNALVEKPLGGNKDDALFAAVQTFEGRFLLAGWTESKGKGGKDAWLLLTDERGTVAWDTTFGGSQDDEFRGMASLDDGNVVLFGYRNDRKGGDFWLLKWNFLKRKVVWEKEFGKKDFENAAAIAALPGGGVALTGNCDGSSACKTGDVWVLKLRSNGEEEWRRSFDGSDGDWDEAQDIIATRDGSLAVAGLSRTRTHDLQAWLLKISRTGTKQWDKTYGGKDADLANSLAQAPDGGFYLTGKSKSYESGARSFQQYLLKTTPGGDLEWEQFLGGAQDEEGSRALVLHDGNLVTGGKTASNGRGGDDAGISCMRGESGSFAAKERDLFSVENIALATPGGDLKPGDRSWLEFDLGNRYPDDLDNVQITLESKGDAPGVRFSQQTYLGRLAAGATRKVRIPVAGVEGLKTADLPFEVKVSAGKATQSFPAVIKTRLPVPPELHFTEENVVSKGNGKWELSLKIQNTGDYPSGSVTLEFHSSDASPISATAVSLGVVAPQLSKEAFFHFQTAKARGEIVCVAKEGGVERRREKICWGCPPDGVEIGYWVNNDTPISTKISSDQPIVEVVFYLISRNSLQPQVFNLKVNGVEWEGSKFKERDIQRSPGQGVFIHHCRKILTLVEGENRAVMEVKIPGSSAPLSVPLLIEYKPGRRNLHLLAIGVPHSDLQFTQEDARDFAAAFESQQGKGKLFGKVFSTLLTAPEATTKLEIEQGMENLLRRSQSDSEDRIGKDDFLVLLISSHGTTVGERFRLLPSDYKSENPLATTVDFKNIILEYLDQIECKKLLFIDACHSGAIGKTSIEENLRKSKALEDALAAIANSPGGMSTLASCKGDQLSYEDPRWQNGAFTEALLDAFANRVFSDAEGEFSADADENGFVALGELYEFVQRRVPHLLKLKTDARTKQTPFMPCKELKETLPVFLLD